MKRPNTAKLAHIRYALTSHLSRPVPHIPPQVRSVGLQSVGTAYKSEAAERSLVAQTDVEQAEDEDERHHMLGRRFATTTSLVSTRVGTAVVEDAVTASSRTGVERLVPPQ